MSIVRPLLRLPASAVLWTAMVFSPALLLGQTLNLQPLERLANRAKETVNVSLDGSLLQLAASFLSSDDPEQVKARQLVANLKGIYVRSYEFKEADAYGKSDLDTLRSQLKGTQWSRIVEVQSTGDADSSELYLQTERGVVQGLALLVSGPKELTVVQIVGPISIDNLVQLGGQMGIPTLKINTASNKKKIGAK